MRLAGALRANGGVAELRLAVNGGGEADALVFAYPSFSAEDARRLEVEAKSSARLACACALQFEPAALDRFCGVAADPPRGVPLFAVKVHPDSLLDHLLRDIPSSHAFSAVGLPAVEGKMDGPGRGRVLFHGSWVPVVEAGGAVSWHLVPPTSHDALFVDPSFDGRVVRPRVALSLAKRGHWWRLKASGRQEGAGGAAPGTAVAATPPFPLGDHDQVAVAVIDWLGSQVTRALARDCFRFP